MSSYLDDNFDLDAMTDPRTLSGRVKHTKTQMKLQMIINNMTGMKFTNLYHAIEYAYKEGFMSDGAYRKAHEIRTLGNEGRHVFE